MLFIAYSTLFYCFGKWDLVCQYHQHRIWTERSHIGGGHVHGPGSWKILPRSWQDHGKIVSPCNTVIVCICYGLICSLVDMCNRGTCTLA